MIFLSRRACMETLYSHIKNKERILVNKRVARIIRAHSRVEIITEDGTVYTGDILAGGVLLAVRAHRDARLGQYIMLVGRHGIGEMCGGTRR